MKTHARPSKPQRSATPAGKSSSLGPGDVVGIENSLPAQINAQSPRVKAIQAFQTDIDNSALVQSQSQALEALQSGQGVVQRQIGYATKWQTVQETGTWALFTIVQVEDAPAPLNPFRYKYTLVPFGKDGPKTTVYSDNDQFNKTWKPEDDAHPSGYAEEAEAPQSQMQAQAFAEAAQATDYTLTGSLQGDYSSRMRETNPLDVIVSPPVINIQMPPFKRADLPADLPANYEIGLIQNVRSFNITCHYANPDTGAPHTTCVIAVDGYPANDTEPDQIFYRHGANFKADAMHNALIGRPADYVPDEIGIPPIDDMPQQVFPTQSPDGVGRLVRVEGLIEFSVWAVVLDTDTGHISHFLQHLDWECQFQGTFDSKFAFTNLGETRVVRTGKGKGAADPVIGGPSALEIREATAPRWS